MEYVKKLLQRNCYAELHEIFVQSHGKICKEISESYAAFYHFCKIGVKIDEYTNIHIGDGSMCRTGALFSFMTKSNNISIDPQINTKKMELWIDRYKVKSNFSYHKGAWQNIILDIKKKFNILLVHSHVNIVDIDKKYPNWEYIYSNPCCMPDKQLFDVNYQYKNNIKCIVSGRDTSIMSPQNYVYIYKNEREKAEKK